MTNSGRQRCCDLLSPQYRHHRHPRESGYGSDDGRRADRPQSHARRRHHARRRRCLPREPPAYQLDLWPDIPRHGRRGEPRAAGVLPGPDPPGSIAGDGRAGGTNSRRWWRAQRKWGGGGVAGGGGSPAGRRLGTGGGGGGGSSRRRRHRRCGCVSSGCGIGRRRRRQRVGHAARTRPCCGRCVTPSSAGARRAPSPTGLQRRWRVVGSRPRRARARAMHPPRQCDGGEIGRASCRERV